MDIEDDKETCLVTKKSKLWKVQCCPERGEMVSLLQWRHEEHDVTIAQPFMIQTFVVATDGDFVTLYQPDSDCLEQRHCFDLHHTTETSDHGILGPFQTCFKFNSNIDISSITIQTIFSMHHLKNMLEESYHMIRRNFLANGLIPIVQHIVQLDKEVHAITVSFDLLLISKQHSLTREIMNLLQSTRNAKQVQEMLQTCDDFSQMLHGHTWSINTLLHLSEEISTESKACNFDHLFNNDGFSLASFQIDTVLWMQKKEKNPFSAAFSFWIPVPTQPNRPVVFCSPFFQALATEDVFCDKRGGIITQGHGTGKIIQVLTLIVSQDVSHQRTLIITNPVKINRWSQEMKRFKADCDIRAIVYHGQSKQGKWPNILQEKNTLSLEEANIIVTTYSSLRDSLLQQTWDRVVVDEAHMLFNQQTYRFQMITQLQGKCWWMLTVQPIVKSLMDLKSLLHPFAIPGFNETFWERVSYELGSLKNGPFRAPAESFTALFFTFATMILRHHQVSCPWKEKEKEETKSDLIGEQENKCHLCIDGEVSIQLNKITLAFENETERRVYDFYNKELLNSLEEINNSSKRKKIEFLRRLCSFEDQVLVPPEICLSHPDGVSIWKTLLEFGNVSIKNTALESCLQPINEDCAICYQTMYKPVQTLCRHVFCKHCLLTSMSTDKKCPLCRQPINVEDLTLPNYNDGGPAHEGLVARADSTISSLSPPTSPEPSIHSLSLSPESVSSSSSSSPSSSPSFSPLPPPSLELHSERDEKYQKIDMKSKIHFVLDISGIHAERSSSFTKCVILTQYQSTLQAIEKTCSEQGQLKCWTVSSHTSLFKRRQKWQEFINASLDKKSLFITTMQLVSSGLSVVHPQVNVVLFEPCLSISMERNVIIRLAHHSTQSPLNIYYLAIQDTIEEVIVERNWKYYQT